MFKWIRKQNGITRKVAGLAEKEESTKRKLALALSIINDKRKENVPVEIDRRKVNEFDYHLKHI